LLNTQFHVFRDVPLCEDCYVLTSEVYRCLRGHLHDLERRGIALIEASLRSGSPITTEELIGKLKNGM
jgi:hypothetical protein